MTSKHATVYNLDIKQTADHIFKRLVQKDPELLRKINAKIQKIRETPHHEYKILRGPLAGFKRVHIDNCFVLIFTIDHTRFVVEIHHFEHHDVVYRWRPGNV